MTRELGFTIALIGCLWLGSMAWLTGYRSGYEDGADKTMQQVEELSAALSTRRDGGEEPLEVPGLHRPALP